MTHRVQLVDQRIRILCPVRRSPDEIHGSSGYGHHSGTYVRRMIYYNAINETQDILPPRDLYIEVRVLQDCGELYTQSGPVNLTANSTHFLRRVDVEHLIRSGAVVQVARD